MLHAVLEYARTHGVAAEPGFKEKSVRWLLNFSSDGQFLGVLDTTDGNKKSKGRPFRKCPELTQPEIASAGDGCRPFLADSLEVVVGLTKQDEPDELEKIRLKHSFFVNLLETAGATVEQLCCLVSIARALDNSGTIKSIHENLESRKAKPTELATICIVDGDSVSVLVESEIWHSWWQSFRAELAAQKATKKAPKGSRKDAGSETVEMRCVVSGDLVTPCATHNKVAGLSDVGGTKVGEGDALASFDKDAFCSFGLEQGANAAMSEQIVKTYTTALTSLIKTRSRKLGNAKVIYWYSGEVRPDDDILQDLFGLEAPDEEEEEESEEPETELPSPAGMEETRRAQAENRAKKLLAAIQTGERSDLADARFFALTLSGNAGRVVIRDWMEGSFTELATAVDEWFSHLAIIGRDGVRVIPSHKFGAVLAAPVRELKDAPGALVVTLWRCALKRQPIPHHVMAQTLNRVRIDLMQGKSARHARLGLLKAYCIRNERLPDMTNELNELETNPAYLCGRVMAILARIQKRALPGVGAGIVQRYYAAASATPALVLGRLIRNAQIGHLPKIESEGLRGWFDRRLADVWSQMKSQPPRVLSLEEQTLFAMGYYHQMADRGGSETEETPPSETPE